MNKFIRFSFLSLTFLVAFLLGSNNMVLAEVISKAPTIDSLISQLKSVRPNSIKAINIDEQLGSLYCKQNDIDNSIKYFGDAESTYMNMGDLASANNVITQILEIGINNKRYSSIIEYSLDFINNSTKLYKKTGDTIYLKNMVGVYYLIATTCNIVGDNVYGKEYFEIGNSIESKYNIVHTPSLEYVKANYYYYQNNFLQSEKYSYDGIILAKQSESKNSYLTGLLYLSRVQIAQNNLTDAKQNLDIVGAHLEYINNTVTESEYYFYLGSYYLKKKMYQDAITSLVKAYSFTKGKKSYEINTQILENVGNSYYSLGDYSNASKYYRMYINEAAESDSSKEKINATMLLNNHNNDPQNILNEIKIKKSESDTKILMIITIIILMLFLLIIYAYYSKRKNIKTLNNQLSVDVLTGAYNRRYAFNYMNRLVKAYQGFSVVMVDVDNYKSVNDTYGHTFGDFVLKRLVNVMNAVGGPKVLTCRYGGEEFLLVIEVEDFESSIKIADRVRRAIEGIEWEYGNTITVSMGLAKYERAQAIDKIIEKADEFLYIAKKSGKNRVEF